MPPFEIPFKLEHPPEIGDVQWLIVSGIGFLLLALIVGKWIVPMMITPHLVDRKRAIEEADGQVSRTLEETKKLRDDYHDRLQSIQDEAERRMQEAVHEAEELRERILVEAQASAEALLRRSEEEVAHERAKAMINLRLHFVDSVVRAAQYAASHSVDSAQHRRLVDEFVHNLGARQ